MKVNKPLFSATLILGSLLFTGNFSHAQVNTNISAGFVVANNKYSGTNSSVYKTDSRLKPGFSAGLQFKINNGASITTDFQFTGKSYSYTIEDATGFYYNEKLDVNYLTIKPAINVNVYKKNKLSLLLGAGCFGGRAVSGNFYKKEKANGTIFNTGGKIEFGPSYTDKMQFIDFGLFSQFKVAYSNFFLLNSYDISLTTNGYKNSNIKRHWRSFFISTGYSFSLSKKMKK